MRYFLLCLSLLSLTACNLIFEEDLSTKKVDLLSPPNGYVTPTQTQTFVWDSLPDVGSYRFQLVSKRFDFIEDYVLDTTLSGTRLTLGLTPRQYQWRVIGINNSSETDHNIYDLEVVQDTSLANQTVLLIAPTPNQLYESDSVAFLWVALNLATQYQVQVATNPSFNSQTIVVDTSTQQDFVYIVDQLGLGRFYYRIRALGTGQDQTPFTTSKQLDIDAKPIPRFPANNSTPTLAFNIEWQRASNVIKDSLFLYYNTTNTPYQRLELANPNYTFTATDTVGYGPGTYYWEVRSVGANGALSSFSNLWQFTLN